jgi:hypothetical protein
MAAHVPKQRNSTHEHRPTLFSRGREPLKKQAACLAIADWNGQTVVLFDAEERDAVPTWRNHDPSKAWAARVKEARDNDLACPVGISSGTPQKEAQQTDCVVEPQRLPIAPIVILDERANDLCGSEDRQGVACGNHGRAATKLVRLDSCVRERGAVS